MTTSGSAQALDGGDPWGRTRESKAGAFGRHHVTSTIRLFVDARGRDRPRLGITVRRRSSAGHMLVQYWSNTERDPFAWAPALAVCVSV